MLKLSEAELKAGKIQWSNHPRERQGIVYRVWLKWMGVNYVVSVREKDADNTLRVIERRFLALDDAQRCFDRLARDMAVLQAIHVLGIDQV